MFTYRIQMLFPTYFQQQVLAMQFDYYDTGKENDYITIERIAKNLNSQDAQDKTVTVQQMKSMAEKESKKSMVGKINAEVWQRDDVYINNRLEDLARENNVKSSFFNLDKPQAKLKRADWLQYVRMEGAISEAVKR